MRLSRPRPSSGLGVSCSFRAAYVVSDKRNSVLFACRRSLEVVLAHIWWFFPAGVLERQTELALVTSAPANDARAPGPEHGGIGLVCLRPHDGAIQMQLQTCRFFSSCPACETASHCHPPRCPLAPSGTPPSGTPSSGTPHSGSPPHGPRPSCRVVCPLFLSNLNTDSMRSLFSFYRSKPPGDGTANVRKQTYTNGPFVCSAIEVGG